MLRYFIYCIPTFQSLKGNNQVTGLVIVLFVTIWLSCCDNTEGTLSINGKVRDEFTGEQISGKNIIIQGLIDEDEKISAIDVGQFTTDSLGTFTCIFRKIKDARYYNLCLTGDSDYAVLTRKYSLYELEHKAKYIVFSLKKLVDLNIIINRESKTPYRDTLNLYWRSDGVPGRFVYPYKIKNLGKANHDLVLSSTELRWIGGNVNSIVRTKVFSDKLTKIYWDLDRNGKRNEITDTITCRRDRSNIVYFTY